jgi:large subunit ribosomal protein L1
MADTKKPEDIKAEEETRAELAEVQADAGEIGLTADVVAGAEHENLAKPGSKETKEIAGEDHVSESDAPTDTATGTDAKGEEPKAAAKAGKRSAKAVRAAEAEEARQEAKEHRAEQEAEEAAAPKAPKRQLPNPLHQHGKKYRAAAKKIEKTTAYSLDDALKLAKETATTKFDSSVELHVNLGVDPRQAEQMVRSSVVLPHGTGRSIRVAVFADGKAADDAKTAGADLVGTDKLLADIEKGKTDFDMLVATPDKMATLGKVAKILGPRGLMPNPKSGTVTPDVARAVKEAKAGKVEFRIDKQAIVHQAIGKVSFSDEHLRANAGAFLSAILKAKPSAAKGTYVKAVTATTSMGPAVKVDAPATISAISTGRK